MGRGAPFTLVTYNIRAGIGAGEFPAAWWRTVDPARIEGMAAVIRDLGADIVALQEVALTTIDGVVTDQAAQLGHLTGLEPRYGAVGHFPIVDPDSGDVIGASFWGNAILSRFPVLRSRTVGLPIARDDDLVEPLESALELAGVRYADAPVGARERRCAVIAELATDDGPLEVMAAHLTHVGAEQRALQVRRMAEDAARGEGPLVVAGDLNTPVDAPELAPLRDRLHDAFAGVGVPAGDEARVSCYTIAIDHILVRRLRVLSCRVAREAGDLSDHWPVVADLSPGEG